MTWFASIGKIVLVLATIVFLLSIGGGMLFAWPVLVPLHWVAARRSGPAGTAGWAFLAGLSLAEVAWMLAYVVTGESPAAIVAPVVAFAGTVATFLVRGANRVAPPAVRSAG